jgi:hypothetical protein
MDMRGLLQQPGMPEEQVPQEQMQPEQMPPEQMPPEQMAPEEAPDESIDENHPSFMAAMEFANEALYGKKAANDVVTALQKSGDISEGLATTSYEMASIIDERVNLPDELLLLLGARILEEVASIAQTAQIQVQPADIGMAFRDNLLRFLSEQGHDVSQLQAAMEQMNPEDFNTMAQEQPQQAPVEGQQL